MDRVHHLFPACERFLPMERRHIRIAVRRRMVNGGAFSDDQANAGLGTAAVIGHHVFTRHSVGREIAGHRGHGHAVAQLEVVDFKRFKQRTQVHAHGNVQPH